jgi:copper chaperone CopZ
MSTRLLLVCIGSLGLAGLAGCASTGTNNADAGMISVPIEGMACPNCAKEIEGELAKVPGVRKATVNFDKKVANVTLDSDRPATREQLNAAVEHWRVEHFGVEEDENCLDPQRREEIKAEQVKSQK